MSRVLVREMVNYHQMIVMLLSSLGREDDVKDLTEWEIRFIKSHEDLSKNYSYYRKYLTRNQKNKIVEIWNFMFGGADISALTEYTFKETP